MKNVDPKKKKRKGKKEWMKKLSGEKYLYELSIPGTHQSISRFGFPWDLLKISEDFARCQTLTLLQQLELGVRFLDVRCSHVSDSLKVFHGHVPQRKSFGDVQKTCIDFLKSHCDECIILRLREEGKSSKCTRKYEETLEDLVSGKKKKYWFLGTKVPKLKQVRGKIVLVRDFAMKTDSLGIHYWNKKIFSVQDYYNILDLDKKKRLIKARFVDCSKLSSSSSSIWNLNYLSGYNVQGKRVALDVIGRFFTKKRSNQYPFVMSTYTNKFCLDLLKKESFATYGTVMMDFVNENLVDKIISRNETDKKKKDLV